MQTFIVIIYVGSYSDDYLYRKNQALIENL